MIIVDAKSAYYQSDALRHADGSPQVMRPPPDVEPPTVLWALLKAMPGTRTASRSWQDHQCAVYQEKGEFERCPMDPCFYLQREFGVRTEVHGDDACNVANRERRNWICTFYLDNFICEIRYVIGLGPDMVQEGLFLKRAIYVGSQGWAYEGDTKHCTNLLNMHGLGAKQSKGAPTP